MDKRKFLKTTIIASTGMAAVPSMVLSSCTSTKKEENKSETVPVVAEKASSVFTLPKLSYGYDAFPDTIDAMTMEIHHSKHHQGYVNKLNKALEESANTSKDITDILRGKNLSAGVRNNGGGHFNHSLYWDILTPGGSMSDAFKELIIKNFNSIEAFKGELANAGKKRFGSGWAWLCQDTDKKLFITSTANQDNPLMTVAEKQGHPILGIDVWEHAYYLKYQNKRGDYLNNIINIINWQKVESRIL
ncbi:MULTISPECIES: superoxide dismutase [Aquimarina]|uniref:superoxide dismutase n=1 Tax=Aquimarina TaxID=290174 RepID=UPI000A539365|nr:MULTISPECIES: superoxide dismutase [Aquimarina]